MHTSVIKNAHICVCIYTYIYIHILTTFEPSGRPPGGIDRDILWTLKCIYREIRLAYVHIKCIKSHNDMYMCV
jgi:hypothetical protein